VQAAIYSLIDGIREAVDGPLLLLAAWILLGLLFDCSGMLVLGDSADAVPAPAEAA